MSSFQKFIIVLCVIKGFVFLILCFGFIALAFLQIQINEDRLSIEQEKHIDKLYSIYQNNINVCANQARENEKDDEYIIENCVKPINESIVANWLKERGYDHLLEKVN